MKKRSLIILFLCFLLLPSIAQTLDSTSFINSLSFALGGQVNVRVGHQGEYVYEPISNDRLLSYLEWDEKPVFSVGLLGGIGFKGFEIHVEANIAFPGKSGTVADSDYMNVTDFPSCTDSIASIKTNYSESLCCTNSLSSIQVQLSYRFSLNPVLSLVPFLGYDFQYSDLSAWGMDGLYYKESYREQNGYYGWYDTSGHNYKIYYSQDTETLNLTRNYHITWVGLTASFNLSKYFALDVTAGISPFIIIQSLDSHIIRNIAFYDDTHSFFSGGKASVALSYKINLHNCIHAKVEWQSTGIADGITYSGTIGSQNYIAYPNSHAGADQQTLDFTLGYKYIFN